MLALLARRHRATCAARPIRSGGIATQTRGGSGGPPLPPAQGPPPPPAPQGDLRRETDQERRDRDPDRRVIGVLVDPLGTGPPDRAGEQGAGEDDGPSVRPAPAPPIARQVPGRAGRVAAGAPRGGIVDRV